jgi:bacillithiol system protein YtxJ
MEATDTRFVRVPDVENLSALMDEPGDVLLFLHDPACPTSLVAYHEIRRIGQDVALIDVRRQRELSRAIERRTGIHHESPQAILLRHGVPVWTASHWEITEDALTDALSRPVHDGP